MDDIDRANEQAQMILDHNLSVRNPVGKIRPIGECHWCGEQFEDSSLKLFCNSDHAKLHHRAYGS